MQTLLPPMEGITREDLDKQAYETQMKAAQAIAEGRFDKSLGAGA